MSSDQLPRPVARRSFLSGFGLGAVTVGAFGGMSLPLRAQTAGAFQPTRHAEDDWLELPGKHRFALDATTPAAADESRLFVDNYFVANKNGYGLDPGDLPVVVILRHYATPFAYNDAIWKKYGSLISEELKFTDPNTKQAPRSTCSTRRARRSTASSAAACTSRSVAWRRTTSPAWWPASRAATLAAIYEEAAANLIGNAHMVAAGIVAVDRVQERGYTFAYVG